MKQQPEYQLQCQVFEWANLMTKMYPCLAFLNSSQNGVKLTSAIAGARAKKSGMKKGFPDIFLPYRNKNYSGLFIELKIKPKKPTIEQLNWIDWLNRQGYKAVVCYDFENAINIIKEYVKE